MKSKKSLESNSDGISSFTTGENNPVIIAGEKALHLLNQYENDIPKLLRFDNDADNDTDNDTDMDVNPSSPSTNISIPEMVKNLSKAGEDLIQAWEQTQNSTRHEIKNDNDIVVEVNKNDSSCNHLNEEKFRESYMNLVTEAFGSELEAMRSESIPKSKAKKHTEKKRGSKNVEDNEAFHTVNATTNKTDNNNPQKTKIDLDILIDCLESGINVFTKKEKELMIATNL